MTGYGSFVNNVQYDANGNMTGVTSPPAAVASYTYDVQNRMVGASLSGPVTENYGYAPDNKRVWKKKNDGSEEMYFYAGNKILGVYVPTMTSGGALYFQTASTQLWFGGRKVEPRDRVGSYVTGGYNYYPYGEATTSPSTGSFATYSRDATGLDYADQRYYASQFGRFQTPDPYVASGGAPNPNSWNRYGYVEGDPINFFDRSGLMMQPGSCGTEEKPMCDIEGGGFEGSGSGGGARFAVCTVDGIMTDCGFAMMLHASGAALTPAEYEAWWFTVSHATDQPLSGWGQAENACHDRNLSYLANAGINPSSPQFGDNGGISWTLYQSNAVALQQQLISQGFHESTVTGVLHNDDVGSPNTDYRSYNGQYGDRSVQVVVGPVLNGQARVYADTDLFNPYGGFGAFLGHAFAEVFPGALGVNTSCFGAN